MSVKLIWITPHAQQVISDCARVSNPANQGKDGTKLINYLIENKHWSPLEMASACFEIETTRDIARQILRHRSFSFQEFSQRYADVSAIQDQYVFREARLQDAKNRQNSIENTDEELQSWFDYQMHSIQLTARQIYEEALKRGIAKEQARCVLPEGLTMSRMYMTGTIRSWKHYVDLRSGNGTQKEHQLIAQAIGEQLKEQLPNLF
jgi:thymidylate synthase (FAD)